MRVIDLLHKAAYRATGLGNSLWIAKHQIGKVSSETLQHYVASHFTPENTAVVGLGVNHSFLSHFAQGLKFKNGSSAQESPAKYASGEIR